MNHHDTAGHFPPGGWGWWWVGDADRGFSKDQPGGWIFNILPFIEENTLYDLAGDGSADTISTRQHEGIRDVVSSPVQMIQCPSRRIGLSFAKPWDGTFIAFNSARNASRDNVVGRGDYAVNCGDIRHNEYGGSNFPGGSRTPHRNYDSADNFRWCGDTKGNRVFSCGVNLTGVSFQLSEIAIKDITDGSSNTYLVGERYRNPEHYEDGLDPSDNETWCTGYNNDNFRNASSPPLQDRHGFGDTQRFGSAHPSTWHVAMCDGSVHAKAYDIDPIIHKCLANRKDGLPCVKE